MSAAVEQTGDGAVIEIASTASRKLFMSTEREATGAEETIAHGLGKTPVGVMVVPTDVVDNEDFIVTEGSHTARSLLIQVQETGVKYKVMAIA